MADVRKCDRCGIVFTPTNGEKKEEISDIIHIRKKFTGDFRLFDICPKCMKEFEEWMKNKPINRKRVVFDFDGVIHSYTSGWKGIDVIPDPPVEGIKEVLQKLIDNQYEVCVLSTRCSEYSGYKAIQQWLVLNDIPFTEVRADKPPAICYVDDRALKFDANYIDLLFKEITTFKTWQEEQK